LFLPDSVVIYSESFKFLMVVVVIKHVLRSVVSVFLLNEAFYLIIFSLNKCSPINKITFAFLITVKFKITSGSPI